MDPEWGRVIKEIEPYVPLISATVYSALLLIVTGTAIKESKRNSQVSREEWESEYRGHRDLIVQQDYMGAVRGLPDAEKRIAIPFFIQGFTDGYKQIERKTGLQLQHVYDMGYRDGETEAVGESITGRHNARQLGNLEQLLGNHAAGSA